jgi:mono/diheme cytochrome c family protein
MIHTTLQHRLRFAAMGAALALGALLPGGSALAQTTSAATGTGVYTKAQAEEGGKAYEVYCAICHAPREFSGSVFQRRWLTPPVSGIFVHILNTMPQDAPGSLSREEVATLVAYILELNGQPAGPEPLPTETEKLTQIRVNVDPGRTR